MRMSPGFMTEANCNSHDVIYLKRGKFSQTHRSIAHDQRERNKQLLHNSLLRTFWKIWNTSERYNKHKFVVFRWMTPELQNLGLLHNWHPLLLRGIIKFLWLHYNWNVGRVCTYSDNPVLISLTSQNFPSRPQSNGFIKSKQTSANWEIPCLGISVLMLVFVHLSIVCVSLFNLVHCSTIALFT